MKNFRVLNKNKSLKFEKGMDFFVYSMLGISATTFMFAATPVGGFLINCAAFFVESLNNLK